ncbi:metallopeptidase TldD-related protein [Ornithinicoccus halotolerans]|uniref:metallopeptidase TldD-related protein n=1 Tax=Ornithinicoccus halotolerans TaxID=1748220 RepID=UPI0012949716|nr:metallopeptidase TldD-related protein [Ornithinicoccus halotolerans]
MTDAPVTRWLEEALAASTARDCTVLVRESHEVNLRWAGNALTTNGTMTQREATVISTAEVEGGVSAVSVSGPLAQGEDLLRLVRQADRAATGAPADEEATPLVGSAEEESVVDEDFAAPAERVGPEDFAALAGQLGRAFQRAQAAGHLLYGFSEYRRTTTWLGNSVGLRRRAVEPMGRLEVNAKAPDLVNSAWVGAQSNDFADVDVAAMHDQLEQRLGWGQRRVDLPPGEYETILPPGAVVDLLVYAYWTMSARDAEEGRNVYAGRQRGRTRVGERLSPLPVTMASDPHDPRLPVAPFAVVPSSAPGMASVFDNGAPVGRVEWLRDGELAALVRTRAGMRRAGAEGPLPFPSENLIVDAGGTATLEEMVRSTKRGLLLTCLWYIREVDPQTLLLTGLTRDGVYLIEDGEVVAAVNNFRYNESPIDLLGRVTEASRAEHTLCREWNDWFTRSVAPALRIPDFTMSTVSQAH